MQVIHLFHNNYVTHKLTYYSKSYNTFFLFELEDIC